ncbi:MAG: CvpA family protein [Terracidiphilus sp.]|jgi:membrane protein required for colicin V production
MTLVDWIIVVVLAAAVLGGIARGFFRSAFSLAGLILGLALAAWNYWRLAALMKPLIHSVEVANAIAFLVIALAVMAVASILGSMLAKMFAKVGLGCLDRLAGGAFGFVEGMVFVMVCILVTVAFFPQTVWLTDARLPRYFFGALHVSIRVTPSRLSDRVRQELYTLESESQKLIHGEKSR